MRWTLTTASQKRRPLIGMVSTNVRLYMEIIADMCAVA